ncbi:hypothetical protein JCM3775_007272 [Rhodotorula graminis]
MADAAPGQPATLLQRLAHTDPVFARLLTVYSSLTPAVISQRDSVGRSDSNNVANIRAAPERFARGWADLLPDERERAVDLVVSSFCDLEARSARDWTMLPYRELQGKAKRSRILHHHDVAKKELKNLQLKVDEIVSAAPSAASFRTSFSSPDGVTAAKLKRMQKVEWKYCATELQTSLEQLRAGASAAQALALPPLSSPAQSTSSWPAPPTPPSRPRTASTSSLAASATS